MRPVSPEEFARRNAEDRRKREDCSCCGGTGLRHYSDGVARHCSACEATGLRSVQLAIRNE